MGSIKDRASSDSEVANSPKDAVAISSEQQHLAVDISFSNITYTVPLRGGGKKDILKGITGNALSGRVTAIMGASGAGKTTLLDILACNALSGKVGGQILVNGTRRHSSSFQRISCYVLQQDVLLSSATVREAITFSALLKLPGTMTKKEKLDRVDQVLRELDLVSCADTLIGDETIGLKGASGGQKRRVSIGMELVKDPSCILLDEPTSGLDSEMAVGLMDCLLTLAHKNRTVVLTIHQPNSIITSNFDDYMLLADGQLVYGGPWIEAVPFFKSAGYVCGEFINPTDYFLALMKDTEAVEKLVAHQKAATLTLTAASGDDGLNNDPELALTQPSHPTSFDAKDSSVVENQKQEKGGVRSLSTSSRTLSLDTRAIASHHASTPWFFQIPILFQRSLRTYFRNPILFASEFAQYAFMGLFVGLMYLQLNNSVETGVTDRIASVWFAMAVLSFTPSYSAVTVWDRERVLLRREVSSNMYSLPAWFAAKTAVVVPAQIIQTTLFGLIAYFMVGYVISFTNILVYLAAYCMFQIVSESVGVMCGAVTKNATMAVLVLTFVLLFLLSFSGFLVSDVPPYFKWIQKVSFLTYAFAAVVENEFNDVTFTNKEGEDFPGDELIPSTIDTGMSIGLNLLTLLGIMLATRLLAYLSIYGAFKLKFL